MRRPVALPAVRQRSAQSINQYLQNESAFQPDDIKRMSRALEDACKALKSM
jgi:hypothetical protein